MEGGRERGGEVVVRLSGGLKWKHVSRVQLPPALSGAKPPLPMWLSVIGASTYS